LSVSAYAYLRDRLSRRFEMASLTIHSPSRSISQC
jgi:hypothetical protein